MNSMSDRKPYLLRAIYQWILDNDCTPHLVVAAPGAGWVRGVPSRLLEEEVLVLNVSPTATEHFNISNEAITFSARFGGQPYKVWVAIDAVVSLAAKENGEGISLPVAENIQTGPTLTENFSRDEHIDNQLSSSGNIGHLKIIK